MSCRRQLLIVGCEGDGRHQCSRQDVKPSEGGIGGGREHEPGGRDPRKGWAEGVWEARKEEKPEGKGRKDEEAGWHCRGGYRYEREREAETGTGVDDGEGGLEERGTCGWRGGT